MFPLNTLKVYGIVMGRYEKEIEMEIMGNALEKNSYGCIILKDCFLVTNIINLFWKELNWFLFMKSVKPGSNETARLQLLSDTSDFNDCSTFRRWPWQLSGIVISQWLLRTGCLFGDIKESFKQLFKLVTEKVSDMICFPQPWLSRPLEPKWKLQFWRELRPQSHRLYY